MRANERKRAGKQIRARTGEGEHPVRHLLQHIVGFEQLAKLARSASQTLVRAGAGLQGIAQVDVEALTQLASPAAGQAPAQRALHESKEVLNIEAYVWI